MNSKQTLCPICSSRTSTIHTDIYDDRYGYPGYFSIVKCSNCSHRSLRQEESPEPLTKLYTNYYPRRTYSIDQHQPQTETRGFRGWLNGVRGSAFYWVPRNVRILDVGCGFGESLAYYRLRGCDVYGVEADENIRQVADKFGYKIHIGPFDPAIYEANFFDYVTLDQVVEHVVDPIETLRGVARILKKGGVAIFSTPNSNGLWRRLFRQKWIHWHVPYHRQHFSQKSMSMAASQVGLKLKLVRTITNSEWLRYQWLHLLTYPSMGKPSAFWSPDAQGEPKNMAWRIMAEEIHKLKINHVLTRFADLMHLGDNYLFILRKE